MAKITRNLLIFFFLLFGILAYTTPKDVNAHPLDITITTIHLEDNLDEVGSSEPLSVSINWMQVFNIIDADESKITSDLTLEDHLVVADFIKDHLTIHNNEEPCTLEYDNTPKTPSNNTFFLKTILFNFDLNCTSPLDQMNIKNSMLLETMPFQKNIFQINKNQNLSIFEYTMNQDKKNLDFSVKKAISHFQEGKLYLSEKAKIQETKESKQTKTSNFEQIFSSKFTQDNLTIKDLFIICFIPLLIGFLHTLEAGHSKTILAAVIVNKKISLKQSFFYVSVFTLTHMADILIIGIVLYTLEALADISTNLGILQIIAAYSLLGISIVMLFKSTSHYLKHKLAHKHNHTHDHNHDHIDTNQTFKEQLFAAFVSGLAPCLMGWSIFMIVLTSKQFWLIFPVLLFFSFGIFLSLGIVALLLHKFKTKMNKKLPLIGELSPIISSVLLLLTSIYILTS